MGTLGGAGPLGPTLREIVSDWPCPHPGLPVTTLMGAARWESPDPGPLARHTLLRLLLWTDVPADCLRGCVLWLSPLCCLSLALGPYGSSLCKRGRREYARDVADWRWHQRPRAAEKGFLVGSCTDGGESRGEGAMSLLRGWGPRGQVSGR